MFPKGDLQIMDDSEEAPEIEETLPLRAKEKNWKSIGTWEGGLKAQNNSR